MRKQKQTHPIVEWLNDGFTVVEGIAMVVIIVGMWWLVLQLISNWMLGR